MRKAPQEGDGPQRGNPLLATQLHHSPHPNSTARGHTNALAVWTVPVPLEPNKVLEI